MCCLLSAVLAQSLLDDVPRKGRALDAHRKLPHARERFQITQVNRLGRLDSLHQPFHGLDERCGFTQTLALELRREHRRRRLTDRAAVPLEPYLLDMSAIEFQIKRHLVAA